MRFIALCIALGAGMALAEASTSSAPESPPPAKKPYGVIDTLSDDRVFDVGDEPAEGSIPRSRTTPRGNTFYLGEPSEINQVDSDRIKQECQFALEKWGMKEYRRCFQERKQELIRSFRK